MSWQLVALIAPLAFVGFQTLSKLLPKDISVMLVNAYVLFIGSLVMLCLHLIFSPSKSLELNPKYLPIIIGIGVLISIGNFGIIKAYNLGAPQSLFTPIFYIALIVYGILFGLLIWHEQLNLPQTAGIVLSIVGILMIVYFKK